MKKNLMRMMIFFVLSSFIPTGKVESAPTQPTYYFYDIYEVENVLVDNAPWEYQGEKEEYIGYIKYKKDGTTDSDYFWVFCGTTYTFLREENRYSVYHTKKDDYSSNPLYLYETYYYTDNRYDASQPMADVVLYKLIPKSKELEQEYGGKRSVNRMKYTCDLYKKRASKNQVQEEKNLIKKDVILDSTYPINGTHTDGYWYTRKSKLNLGGLGEIDIDNFSEQVKKDIMPVITVMKNQEFNEVVQGRGYMANGVSVNTSDGNVTVFRQDSNYIRVRGKFTQTGIKYLEIPDANGKKAYFLFNVIEDPTPASANGVTF